MHASISVGYASFTFSFLQEAAAASAVILFICMHM
jgi:hypothetical protein